MVKGINRQVIVVRSPDPELFEQAIFLLRPDAQQTCNVTQDELLRQAQAAARGYSTAHIWLQSCFGVWLVAAPSDWRGS